MTIASVEMRPRSQTALDAEADTIQPAAPVESYVEDSLDKSEQVQAGELTLQEGVAGGMGPHLGLFLTTLLV